VLKFKRKFWRQRVTTEKCCDGFMVDVEVPYQLLRSCTIKLYVFVVNYDLESAGSDLFWGIFPEFGKGWGMST
jgi:hypothetical protein